MTFINIPPEQQRAVVVIDLRALHTAVDRCLVQERLTPILELNLKDCGRCIGNELERFARSIDAYAKAKTIATRESTKAQALRVGSDLVHVFYVIRARVETELADGERFFVDDEMSRPFFVTNQLSVSISYRWRPPASPEWKHGQITFHYEYEPPRSYALPLPNRRSTASAREREIALHREWDRLKMQALSAVKEFFRNGGSGEGFPEAFLVRPNPQGSGLNNHSCKFWEKRGLAHNTATRYVRLPRSIIVRLPPMLMH